MAIKRGKGQRFVPLDELRAENRLEMEPADPVTAEMIYERRWALTVLERVLSRLKDDYRAAGNAALFDSLKELLPDEPGSPSQAQIATRLGMTENAVRQAFHRFRQRYQSLLREEIAHTVATAGDIEDELRHLIAVLEANELHEGSTRNFIARHEFHELSRMRLIQLVEIGMRLIQLVEIVTHGRILRSTNGERPSDSNNDQGNQDLPEVRRQNLFRRTGRALPHMCAEKCAWQFPGRGCSRGRRPRPLGHTFSC